MNNSEELSEKSSPEKKEKVRNRKETIKYILKLNCFACFRQVVPRSLGSSPKRHSTHTVSFNGTGLLGLRLM